MATIRFIEDRGPSDPGACPDDLVLTGVLYEVEDGVFLFRAGTHHKDAAGKRRRASSPFAHEATQGVVTDEPWGRVVRQFLPWFDDRRADWDRALEAGAAVAPAIAGHLEAWRPGGGAKVFRAECPGPVSDR